ncbi:MAG: hypothetical protein A2497_03265 [Candidatus Firestonebacteria bacterium RifOxyC12_full_39_7]|nr:MAG: hypothetical protein A2497_03265 [Candidatus Firestonebacteria bacterium RifOxyC12_full_39_7]
MKKAVLLFLVLFLACSIQAKEKSASEDVKQVLPEIDYREEARWHFNIVLEGLNKKEKNLAEAERMLIEIIDFYDSTFPEAYAELMKIYKEKKDDVNYKKIETRYKVLLETSAWQAKEEEKEVYSGDELTNLLIKELGSDDYNIRNKAAAKLQKISKSNTDALIKALNSINIYRACFSAGILGKNKEKAAEKYLIEILNTSRPSLKISALEALGSIGNETSIKYIIETFSDAYYSHYEGKFKVREKAAEVLAHDFKEKAVRPLIEFLNKPDIKWYVFTALSMIKPMSQEVKDLFLTSLADKDDKVRLIAVKLLVDLKDEKLFPKLFSLASDKSPLVRYEIISLLGDNRTKESKEKLLEMLSDTDKNVAQRAVYALGKFNLSEVKDLLLAIAGDLNKDVTVRWFAIKALGENFKKQDILKLKELLEDKDLWVSSAAAAALDIERMNYDEITSGIIKKKQEKLDLLALNFTLTTGKVFEQSKEASIRKGIRFLLSQQEENGSFKSAYFPLGATQMALLVLFKQGWSEEDKPVKKAVDFMLKHEQADGSYFSNNEVEKEKVSYLTGMAIKVLSKTVNPVYKEKVKKSVEFMKSIQDKEGGFGYYKGSRADMSATENVAKGLEEGYNFLNIQKNDEMWIKMLDYLKNHQNEDGGFGYADDNETTRSSYGSMTAVGLSLQSLFKKPLSSDEVKKSIDWLSKNYTLKENPKAKSDKHYPYYLKALAESLNLYGLDTITDKDNNIHYYYKELVEKLMKEQLEDGSWSAKWYEPVLAADFYISILQLKKMQESIIDLY